MALGAYLRRGGVARQEEPAAEERRQVGGAHVVRQPRDYQLQGRKTRSRAAAS